MNLATHRAPASVWDRRGWNRSDRRSVWTRALIGAAGGALLVQGLRQRTPVGRLLAGVGGSLAWAAVRAQCDPTDVSRWVTAALQRFRTPARDDVHEASAESFPASDAPAFTPTVGVGIRHNRHVH